MASASAKSGKTRQPPRRRKQEIVDAAARVFHEKGYESTSIQDIADEVGILKGSLYYYIESKEDLLYEILSDVHDEALRRIEAAVGDETNAVDKVRAFIMALVTYHAENLVRIGVFFNDFRSLRPDRRDAIVRERDRYDRLLRNVIRQGQEDGTICPDVDPKFAALAILGMVNWMYQWYRPGGARTARTIANNYGDIITAGLECSPESHVPGHRRRDGSATVAA
jgi:TetR/AcrR family transcriptional regulator, cholesterol catabolism regulator